MSTVIYVSEADLANIEKFAGRRLSTIKEDEEAVVEDLLNRGLLGLPQEIPDTKDYFIGQSQVPQTA